MAEKCHLIGRMIRRSLFGISTTAALLFLPAGTIYFWQAWVLLIIGDVAPVFWLIYFYQRVPGVIERRLLKQVTIRQTVLVQSWRALALVALALAGFDHRLGWSAALWRPVPLWLEVLSFGFISGACLLHFEVLKANQYAANVIRTETGQTVVERGPYAIIRHPMYFAAIVFNLFAPLGLGSFAAWPVSGLTLPLIILRLLEEEKFLHENLAGYTGYCQKARYRLLPSIW
jgi:protein-S-isoprenylcysteine O-methyltransferase Ste14